MACNSNPQKEQGKTSDTISEKHDEHKEKAGELELNNGAKWKIDSATSVNVGILRTIIADAKNNKPANYAATATKLEDGLNKLVKECKMSGAEHDALHQWLEPMIAKTRELKNAGTGESGEAVLNAIDKQMGLFDQYFEL